MAFGGYLQANTAVDVIVGPFVDDTDGKTAETGLTITSAEVYLSKNGAAGAAKNEATALSHDQIGNYICKLDATDTNTEGTLALYIHESGALPIKMDYMVLAQAAYISLVTAKDTGYMDVDIKAVSTDTTAADNLELFTEILENGTGLIDSGSFKAGAIDANAIAAAAIDNATFAADVGSTAYATNIIALAVRKTLDELNLDHLCKQATAAADMTTEVADNTIISRMLSNGDTSAFVPSTDGLQLIRDKQTDIETDTQALEAFWNVFILTSGTIGATGNDTTHLHLTGQTYGNDELNDYILIVYDNSESEYHSVWITDWVLATALATVETLPFTPENSVDTYWVFSLKKHPDIANILTDTAEIGTAGAGLTDLGGMSTGMKAEVESECNDALVAQKLDHLIAVADDDTPADNSIIAKMASSDGDWSGFLKTTDALEALADALLTQTETGAVSSTVNDASATTTGFDTALTEASDDHYNNQLIVFTSGALTGQSRRITDYDGTDKTITVYPAFTEAPANSVSFTILPYYFIAFGAGALEITYTVYQEEAKLNVLEGATVWITTDSAGTNVIWAGVSDSSGIAVDTVGSSKPWLDAGTYYFWRQKSGYSFSNPDTETFS